MSDIVENLRISLKPCPLCGSEAKALTEGYTRIMCYCGLSFTDGHRSLIKLADKWNTRRPLFFPD